VSNLEKNNNSYSYNFQKVIDKGRNWDSLLLLIDNDLTGFALYI
jgi:hypothetical protein